MSKVKTYIKDCYTELVSKVSWPSWDELQGSVIIVMVASLIIALVVFVMDYVFQNGINLIY
jgi:preprotein translocase subunit SecE